MSEEILRIKIADTEYAGIEVVPTESGVEIVVTRRKKVVSKESGARDNVPKKGSLQHVDNYEILRNFCTKKKNEPGVNQKQLLAFYNFYNSRILEWNGVFMPEPLFAKWKKTEFER